MRGPIRTRSGSWGWDLAGVGNVRPPSVESRWIYFQDRENPNNTMRARMPIDWTDFSDAGLEPFATNPSVREFEDPTGQIWTARASARHPRRISLQTTGAVKRFVEIAAERTLGDLTHEELAVLIESLDARLD